MAGYTSGRPGWLDISDMRSTIEAFDAAKSDVLQVDIGCGYGQDLDRLVLRYPDASGRLILQDQAHVVDKATQTQRIEKTTHDFFTPQFIKGLFVGPSSCLAG